MPRLLLTALLLGTTSALAPLRSVTRRSLFSASSGALVATTGALLAGADDGKLMNLSNEKIAQMVKADLVDGQFLTNGRLTRSIYDEKATFTDEIDTYTLDKWQVGTQKLFVGAESHVALVGEVHASPELVSFRFDEVLAFNVPLHPKVTLTGRVDLARDPTTGLITSYREFWDQSVNEVLRSARI